MSTDQQEAPLEFADYPALGELIYTHTPGYDYLIGLATNVAKFHSAGWRQVMNRTPFLVRGEACLLFRKGEAIWGGNPYDCLPNLFIDTDADRKLGLHIPGIIEGPKPSDGNSEATDTPTTRSHHKPKDLAPAATRPTLSMPTTAPKE